MWPKIFAFCLLAAQTTTGYPVIVLALDGFLPSYLSSLSTPNLDEIVRDGVLLSGLQPEFPASREPFLASLLTGRHSEDHGILAKERYSAALDSVVSIEDASFWNDTREIGTLWVGIRYHSIAWLLAVSKTSRKVLCHIIRDLRAGHIQDARLCCRTS